MPVSKYSYVALAFIVGGTVLHAWMFFDPSYHQIWFYDLATFFLSSFWIGGVLLWLWFVTGGSIFYSKKMLKSFLVFFFIFAIITTTWELIEYQDDITQDPDDVITLEEDFNFIDAIINILTIGFGVFSAAWFFVERKNRKEEHARRSLPSS